MVSVSINSTFKQFTLNKLTYKVCLKTQNNNDKNFISLIECIKKSTLDISQIVNYCKKNYNFFTVIIWRNNFLFTFVDQVSSFPIIYKICKNKISISDDINFFKKSTLNQLSLKLIKYSGYTIDNLTIFKKVYNLLPNEYLLLKNKKIRLKITNNFKFNYKKKVNQKKIDIKFKNLLLSIFNNIKKRNSNRKIFVPLSAGYDSRLILSLLKEVQFKNIETFTYGRKNVRDFEIAKKIASKIGVPNHQILINQTLAVKTYRSKKFNNYLNYCNSGNAPNNFGDFLAINYLMEKKIIKKNDIIINGQTGDFISGNHIPLIKFNIGKKNKDQIINYLIEKNYNLTGNDFSDNDQIEIKKIIKKKYLISNKSKNLFKNYQNYENFEYANRQVKWVVGQQKVYEYFNLNWELPLWDKKIMKFFFNELSMKLRIKQKFFKDHLNKENYAGVWNIETNPKQKFSLLINFIRFLFKIFYFGRKSKWHKFEKKYINYFLDTSLSSMHFKYKEYIKGKNVPRNSIYFYSKKYISKINDN